MSQQTSSREELARPQCHPPTPEASYNNGVLTLVIPVAEQAKPRRLSVARGGEGNGHGKTNNASATDRESAGTSS